MIGTVYLFGIFPIYRGLYAPFPEAQASWSKRARLWVRWTCVIRWSKKRDNANAWK